MNTPKTDLNRETTHTIHQHILASASLNEAASRLGVVPHTLASHLGKFHYQDQTLTFDLFKNLSEEDVRIFWGETYETPMQAQRTDLNRETIHTIHQHILASASLNEAASRLGV